MEEKIMNTNEEAKEEILEETISTSNPEPEVKETYDIGTAGTIGIIIGMLLSLYGTVKAAIEIGRLIKKGWGWIKGKLPFEMKKKEKTDKKNLETDSEDDSEE